MRNLIVRTISGVVYVALMILSLFTKWISIPLMFFFIGFGIFEFFKLNEKTNQDLKNRLGFWTIATICVYNLFNIIEYQLPSTSIFIFLLLLLLCLFLPEFLQKSDNPINNIAANILAQVWITIPLCVIFMLWIPQNPVQVLAYFIIIWSADTFAYLGGSVFGRHKLAKSISPGKTWEGFAISCLLTCALAIGLSFIPYFSDANLPIWKWVILTFSVETLGLVGDLAESLLKRKAGVKDSGKIIPGHGGVLDRLDSILISSVPIYFLCL